MPEEKLQIYKEVTVARAQGNESVAEALRRWGIHSSDLTRISRTVEEGAIAQFKAHRSRKPKVEFSEDELLRLKSNKERLERTVIEQAAELMGKSQKRSRAPQVKPEVKADRPNQVWSWDLTYIPLGPFFVYLFAIIDVYSRKIVIENFIDVYNHLRYHGAIGYVIPHQRHSGEAEAVLEARSERKRLARIRRLEINRSRYDQIQWTLAA
jgi:transposase InsO family protein